MTQDLDALPLPERTYATDTKYNYGDEDISAARREGYKLAKREAVTVEAALKVITDAMRTDPEYAWSWHCNIAMAFVDEGGDHAMANHAAARFMKLLANVEPAHELPERKAQEGREPVGYIDEGGRAVLFPARKNWLEKDKERDHAISRAQQYYSESLLYTPPPPKSDEAMAALIKAARWFTDNPDSPRSALGHITEALAALAAQQSKGEAS